MTTIKIPLQKSRIARRLLSRSIFLATVPVIATAAVLGYMGRSQIVWTARIMEKAQAQTVEDGHHEYQKLGREALDRAGQQTQSTAEGALKSVSHKMAAIQDTALSATTKSFSELTSSSFESAIKQSAETNRSTLSGVRDEMTRLFASSARDTQERGAQRIEGAMLRQVDMLMQERAHTLSGAISDRLKDAENYLMLTAQMPDLREGRVAGQKSILDALVRRFPQMSQVSVLDKNGRETAMSSIDHVVTASDLHRYAEAGYFHAGMRGEAYLGDDGLPALNNAPTVQIAVPIEAYRGKVVGVLEAQYSLSELWDTIRTTRIGVEGFACVQDGSAKYVLAPRATKGELLTSVCPIDALGWRVVAALPREEAMRPIQMLKSDISQNTQNAQGEMRRKIQMAADAAGIRLQRDSKQLRHAAVQQVQDRTKQALRKVRETTARQTGGEIGLLQKAIGAQTLQTQQDSSVRMTSAADVVTAQMSARVRPLTREALAQADRRLLTIALIITGISSVFGCLLALITASRIVRPVVDLAQMTHAIAEGDLEQRVDESAPDELGDLAAAFNSMAGSLQQSRAELREAEGQLVQSAKLASLGELSAGVAHELNQPLAIIRGVVQQLQDEKGISEDVLADLQLVEGQTGRMIKIIQHMRTFCRIGSPDLNEIDLNKTVSDCLLLIGQQLRAHDVELALELCTDAPLILADSNELEQVLINLITNARDALTGRPDARITLRTRVEDDNFVLEVRDNGAGIPDTIAKQIFDPFFTTKEPGKGTGLGLSISNTLIMKHKGTLRVHNDSGAVFTIRLPVVAEDEAAAGGVEFPKAA